MTLSEEQKVALKLMGIEARCRYCKNYDSSSLSSALGTLRMCKAFRTLSPEDGCEDFRPKTEETEEDVR
jgi:hypothetical protein